jgi:AcrR family transcriptional regulator
VHYYFADKVELITHCVRLYKTQCVNRFDEIVLSSRTAEELLEQFAAKLVETMTTEAPLHRLWYDLRTQSLFEASFRDDVLEIDHTLQEMIWRVVDRYAEFVGVTPLLEPQAAYAMFDGLFEKALLGHLSGDAEAAGRLAERVRWLLPQICPGASSAA